MTPEVDAEQARSISWSDGIKGNFNQALVSLGLDLLCLWFSLIVLRCHLVVVIFVVLEIG